MQVQEEHAHRRPGINQEVQTQNLLAVRQQWIVPPLGHGFHETILKIHPTVRQGHWTNTASWNMVQDN